MESQKIECFICGNKVNEEKIHEHHTDYKNDITISICNSCHAKITFHLDKYPELKKYKPIGNREKN